LLLLVGGCTPWGEYIHNGFKVGPNYVQPPAPLEPTWIDATEYRVRTIQDDLSRWWTVFGDDDLNALICMAYRQNITLREAGFRILQARAERGIAVGELFPQTQQGFADYIRSATSQETAGRRESTGPRFASLWDFGFNLQWELDFWGRFRRAVEAADANLDASVANFDDVLVTLLGDVASNYVQFRTFQTRIDYARKNVELQRQQLERIKANRKLGATGIDEEHARSIVEQTAALVPQLEISLRQTGNKLCILLGIPPEDLEKHLKAAPIPTAPPEAVVGIPADLLRRRPDVRRAERQAAAQSAAIGIAEADFYPRISIIGTLGWSAAEFKDLFRSDAFIGTIGPSFRWDLLNYGRILNHVRAQDAIWEQTVAAYQETVLKAYEDVEDGLVLFLKSHQEVEHLAASVAAAVEAERLAKAAEKGGLNINYTQSLVLAQNKVQQEDSLAQARGNVALGLIQVYRGLGGGWQMRCTGCDPGPGGGARLGLPEVLGPAPQPAPNGKEPVR
jgi:NodT family efflux transporter outer membrane factor (OMF) lipoprotein